MWVGTSPQKPVSGWSLLCLLLSRYHRWFDPHGCVGTDFGCLAGRWNHLAWTVGAPLCGQWEGVTLWHSSMTESVHNSPCNERSTMGSWRGLMGNGEASLHLLLHEASQALSQPRQCKTSGKLWVGCHSRWRQYAFWTEAACECKMHHPWVLWMGSATPHRGKWRCSWGILPDGEPLLRGWNWSYLAMPCPNGIVAPFECTVNCQFPQSVCMKHHDPVVSGYESILCSHSIHLLTKGNTMCFAGLVLTPETANTSRELVNRSIKWE